MSAPRALGALFVIALALGPTLAQEQEKTDPKKKVFNMPTVTARAMQRALKADDETLARLNVCPSEGRLLAVAEYQSGAVAVFVGSVDPEKDTFVVLEPDAFSLVQEAIQRSQYARSHPR